MRGRLGINPKRLAAHRFEQIPDLPQDGMANPHDATIDIPLADTPSRGQNGARGWGSGSNTGAAEPGDGEKGGFILNGPGRRRRREDTDINESTGKPSDSPEDGSLNRLGRIYQAIYNFSIVTRYMIYVIPIGALIAIPIIVGATAAQNSYIGGVHIYWFFTWIEVIWVSLWVCKVFAKFIPYVFQFLCGIVSSGTRKYALILRALETPITIVLWTVITLVTFLPIMRYGVDNTTDFTSWEKSVKNILFALLVCSLIYLGEKAIVQLISISYHRKQFDAKIKESKRNVKLVSLLFEASRNMFPVWCREFADEDAIIFDSLLAQTTGNKSSKRGSIVPLRMMREVGRQVGQNVGRIGDKVTAAFGNVASELTGKQVFNPTATHSIVTQALERKRCAAALARRIWMSFVVEGRESLYPEDIVEVLGPEQEAEAEECFAALDRDGNGDISLDEMILTITEFGRMRKSLNHSMHDVDQAIHVLDNLLLAVAFVVGILVFVSFVTSGFGTVIAAGATTLISLSFVFSVTAQEVLGSCIFLFVKHPFDIGDRVDVNDKSYVVERISLLFSVFRNVGDHRMTQVPNNILNSLWIDNLTRANAMHEQLTVSVSFDTSFAEIQALREEMEAFVRDKDNCRDFQQDMDVEVVGVGDMDKLELRVDIRHKSNWSNETVRASRRSKFMCALVLAMRKVHIRGPGAAAPEEETTSEDGDSDKGDDAGAGSTTGNRKSTHAGDGTDSKRDGSDGMAAAAAGGMMQNDSLSPNMARSSGIDQDRSSGSVSHRGSTAKSEAAIADRLNSRAPAADVARDEGDVDLYRTTTGSSGQGRQLSVNNGVTGGNAVSRGLSTGHRKAGARASYNEEESRAPPMPAPLTPVQAGLTPSSSNVPILGTPAPGSRGSVRYEPPNQAPNQAPTLPIIGSPESGNYHSYYNRDTTYESVPLGGASHEETSGRDRHSGSGAPYSGVTASSHYELPDRYDPVSPPSIYSPPHSQAPAPAATAPTSQPAESGSQRSSFLSRTLRRGKGSKSQSGYPEHEA